MKPIVKLYILATFLASVVAVGFSFTFPTELQLQVADAKLAPPSGIIEVLHNLILSVVDNPLNAIVTANYIGILAWAVLAGIALHSAADSTKVMLDDLAKTVTKLVEWVIRFAPFGIMGLVANAIGQSGLGALLGYIQLLGVLLGAFFSVALIMNPIIVYLNIHCNPYPLVWTTLKESGLYAFFTRSSAANIPVNPPFANAWDSMRTPIPSDSIGRNGQYERCGHHDCGAVTGRCPYAGHFRRSANRTAALHRLNGRCLRRLGRGRRLAAADPVACASFGISNDIAMQVVGVGFIIGVLQDSCETALNSSSDVLFTATAEFAERQRGQPHCRGHGSQQQGLKNDSHAIKGRRPKRCLPFLYPFHCRVSVLHRPKLLCKHLCRHPGIFLYIFLEQRIIVLPQRHPHVNARNRIPASAPCGSTQAMEKAAW